MEVQCHQNLLAFHVYCHTREEKKMKTDKAVGPLNPLFYIVAVPKRQLDRNVAVVVVC